MLDAGRVFRDIDGIAALELIDARASALTASTSASCRPSTAAWLLLIEMAGDMTRPNGSPMRWQTPSCPANRQSAPMRPRSSGCGRSASRIAEILGIYGPPLKFDVSLPLPAIPAFATAGR